MKTNPFTILVPATIAALLVQVSPQALAMGAGTNSLSGGPDALVTMVAPAANSAAALRGCQSIATAGTYRVLASQNGRTCVLVGGSVIWLDVDASSSAAPTRAGMRGNGARADAASRVD